MPQSLAALYCHIVFSTKNREPFIDLAIRERLYADIGSIVRDRNSALLLAGGMPDHVHLLVSFGRQWAVSDMVRDIKANSSRWVHETFQRHEFAWQAGYGAFSVSPTAVDAVKKYIATQEEHHERVTYQEEFRDFLRKYGIEYDERYVWD